MTARAKPAPKPTLSGFCEAAPSYAHPADAHAACRMPGCVCDCHRDDLEPTGIQEALPVPRVKVPLACLQGRHTADCGHETPAGEGAVPGEPRDSSVGEDPSPAGPDPSLAPGIAGPAEPPAVPPVLVPGDGDDWPASAREGEPELLEIDEHGLAVAPLEESDHGWPAEAGAALEQLLGTPVSPLTPTRLHDHTLYATDPVGDLEAAAELVERQGYAPAEQPPQAPADLTLEEKRIIVAAHLKLDPEAAYDAVREILARRGGGWPA